MSASETAATIYALVFGPIGVIAGVIFLKWKNRRDERKLDAEMAQIRADLAKGEQKPD
ncbi:MAG: hypothetical protein ACK4X1_04510 [Terricaulis sp.]